MHEYKGFVRRLRDIARVVWFLYRVDLVEDTGTCDGRQLGETLPAESLV